MTATATTSIIPTASDTNSALPERNIPLMAIITARPETTTARPEVAAAISTASTTATPRGPLLPLTAEVEQRVVDADGHPDEQDHAVR